MCSLQVNSSYARKCAFLYLLSPRRWSSTLWPSFLFPLTLLKAHQRLSSKSCPPQRQIVTNATIPSPKPHKPKPPPQSRSPPIPSSLTRPQCPPSPPSPPSSPSHTRPPPPPTSPQAHTQADAYRPGHPYLDSALQPPIPHFPERSRLGSPVQNRSPETRQKQTPHSCNSTPPAAPRKLARRRRSAGAVGTSGPGTRPAPPWLGRECWSRATGRR
jgi:hypothetical protein